MSAVHDYLEQFYDDPHNIEEFKINFLKNHFYNRINKILNTEFEDFLIGVWPRNNRKLIYFKSKKNSNNSIILNRFTDKLIQVSETSSKTKN